MAEFEVVRVPTGKQLIVDGTRFGGQLKPVKLFILPHGSIDQKPSLAWELVDGMGLTYIAQITEKMLLDGLEAAKEARAKDPNVF